MRPRATSSPAGRSSVRPRRAALLAALLAASGCREVRDATLEDSAAARDSASSGEVQVGPREVVTVQIAAFADSAVAERMRDSLERVGWTALTRVVRQQDTLPPYRVRVMPTPRGELARLVATGFLAAGARPMLVPEVALPVSPSITLQPVNRATRDAGVRLRWVHSPDRSALLVVEDVGRRDGAPAPDGFAYVDDATGVMVQRDSVWDVAPSPSWRRLAYGKAYVISAVGRDSLSIAGWVDASARTTIQIHLLREGAFRYEGQRPVFGVSQPVVESTHPDSLRDQSLTRVVSTQLPFVGGWRIRWTPDGELLGVGIAPRRAVADDSPPARWLAVQPGTGLFEREVAAGSLRSVAWTMGPRVDSTTTLAGHGRRLEITGGAVEARDGWVVVRGAVTGGQPVVLGPGAPLATTRSGRFVLALVPAVGAREGAPTVEPMIYRLR